MVNFVEKFNFYGTEAKEIPCIRGEGAPTSVTEGAVGCFYLDTLTGKVYKCKTENDGVLVWICEPAVCQTTGQSKTDVMSQKAVTYLTANAIKGSANGNPIRIDDSSPFEHEMKVGVEVKNLISYPYYNIPSTSAGVTFADNGNGTITLNGTANGTPSVNFSSATLPKGTYRISSGVENSTGVSVRVYDSKGTNIGHSVATSIQSFTITEPSYVTFRLYGESGKTYENLVVYPQLEKGTTQTAFAPYVESVNGATVQKYGKNIFPLIETTVTSDSTSMVSLSNGHFLIRGDGKSKKAVSFDGDRFIFPSGTYTFSATHISGTSQRSGSPLWIGFKGYDAWGVSSSDNYRVIGLGSKNYKKASITFTLREPQSLYLSFTCNENNGDGYIVDDCQYLLQLEVNSIATEFEEIKEPITYTADENGNVSGIVANGESMTLVADSGITISAEYSVDTKKYIDKKFAELQALVLEV